MTEKLKAVVSVSYNTVAETEDPFLVIEIMRMIAEHEAANPKPSEDVETAEQVLLRERDEARAQVEGLQEKVQNIQMLGAVDKEDAPF